MPTFALRAHFAGERIVPDEPFDLPGDASLIVTLRPVASSSESESEGTWLRAAAAQPAFAFPSDPAGDLYTLADGQPPDHAL